MDTYLTSKSNKTRRLQSAVYGAKRELPGTAIQLHRPIDFAKVWHGMAWHSMADVVALHRGQSGKGGSTSEAGDLASPASPDLLSHPMRSDPVATPSSVIKRQGAICLVDLLHQQESSLDALILFLHGRAILSFGPLQNRAIVGVTTCRSGITIPLSISQSHLGCRRISTSYDVGGG